MKYKSLPPEPTGWEPESSCAIGSDYDSDSDDQTSETEEPDFDASDLDSEKSFTTTTPRKTIKNTYKSKKAIVVGMLLQEDLCYFPE